MRSAEIGRGESRRCAVLALAALFALLGSGCRDDHFDATCRAEDGRVELTWNALADVQRFRVRRAIRGSPADVVGDVEGTGYADAEVQNDTLYDYVVRPLLADGSIGGAVATCSAMPSAGNGGDAPPAIDDLACQPGDGAIDLAWSAASGALSYRVLRSGGGSAETEIADVGDPAYADPGLINGSIYEYSVIAVDAVGQASPQSNTATCEPLALGEGEPPPVVAAPTCRAKNDKVDVTWTPVAGAAFYRVSRVQGGGAPVLVGEVSGNVLADFGLPLDVAQQYSVASVSPTGAVSAASGVCNVTPRGRADGNRAPVFTSEPLTSAIERHNWYIDLMATDPDGDAVSFAIVTAPDGMRLNDALLTWIPTAAQIGAQVVEVRATDARGAWATQAFVVDVADYDEPPQITSIPVKLVEAGQPYRYDIDGFDPEGAALRFAFGVAAPAGMSIDPASGLVSWTPSSADSGKRTIVVRAADPSGGFDEQSYALDVFTGGLELLAPKGEFEIEVGDTLDLAIRANQPAALLYARPLPRGANLANGHIVFTPTADQVGRYAIAVQAKLGSIYALESITVNVVRGNRPPVLADPGPQQVPEGGELVVPLVASDPDGDAVSLAPAAPLPANTLLDAVGGRLIFRPSYEQAGSIALVIAASDGQATTSISVPIEVAEREPPVAFTELVIDRVQSPTLQPRVNIRGNVVGDPALDPEPQLFVAVNGLAPASGRQGRALDVTITGLNTEFVQGQTVANFGEGITVESLAVLSPTSARAHIAIAAAAALGTRVVTLSGNGPAASSIVAFVVEAGAVVFSGQLVDSFTQQPLANARVSIDGTLLEVETDAQGRFSIEGVPPGAHRIVVLRNDYDVQRLDLVFEPGTDLALEQAVPLEALARPFQPGGSLPRAANLASVLDRGVGAVEQTLTQEQAEALIEDTLLVVGGSFVGVLDEAGNQLNPQITGNGMMSYTREGLAAQARALLEGQRYSLREIAAMLTTAFDWGAAAPDMPELVDALQRFADEAWEDPSDPLNAMAFVLLNEGTTLATHAPDVTPETSFNRFQASLLTLSILIPFAHELDQGADRRLREIGIDPETIGARPAIPSRDAARLLAQGAGGLLGGALDWLVPAAHAQSGGEGEVILGPNTTLESDAYAGSTMTRVWNHMKRNFTTDVLAGNFINAAVQMAIQSSIALAIGSTGGITGITLATGYITAIADGFLMSVLEKLVLGYVIAAAADSMEPSAPLPQRSFIDEDTDSLVIEFVRSVTETQNTNEVRQYSYEIFEFADPITSDAARGVVVDVATLSQAPDSDRLRFSIPLGVIAPGVHYYRMATVQYAGDTSLPLSVRRREFPYQSQVGANAPPLMTSLLGAGKDWTNYAKAQYRFNSIQEAASRSAIDIEMQQRLGGLTNRFESQVAVYDIEIDDLNQKKIQIDTDLRGIEANFENAVGREITKIDALVGYAREQVKAGTAPGAFLDTNSGANRGTEQILGYARQGDTLRPEVTEKMAEIARGQELVSDGTRRRTVVSQALTDLEDVKARLDDGTLTGPERNRIQVTSMDSDGKFDFRDIDLPEDPARARIALDQAIELQQARLVTANGLIDLGESNISRHADDLFDQEVPSHVPHEETVSQKMTEGAQLERRRTEAIEKRRNAKRASNVFDAEEAGIRRRNRPEVFQNAKPEMRSAVAGLSIVGAGAQALGEIQMAFESLRVIYSVLSPPFRYTRATRNVPSHSIEADPNLHLPDGIIASRKGERFEQGGQVIDQSRTGWLLTSFLDTGGPPAPVEAGYPPEFLAVDAAGRIYAHNGNSATRFGGRIFRFDTEHGFAREFIGSVNYYSSLIQYGKPANPIAMTTGIINSSGRRIESLFIADVELVGNAGVSLERPQPGIKQLPIQLVEQGEPYHDPATRNHLVGQPFVQDPRFKFTGPTDMVAVDTPGATRLYVSDEQSIYVVIHDLASGANDVREILNVPGRQWSGLAVDLAAAPNFYFADATTGFVYYVEFDDLLRAEQGGSLETSAIPLVPFVRDGQPLRVYDIEIAQGGERIVAATERGLAATYMPAVEHFTPEDPILFLKRLGRETRGLLVRALNGELFRVLALTQEDHEAARVRIVARPPANATQAIEELDLTIEPVGPTVVGVPQ